VDLMERAQDQPKPVIGSLAVCVQQCLLGGRSLRRLLTAGGRCPVPTYICLAGGRREPPEEMLLSARSGAGNNNTATPSISHTPIRPPGPRVGDLLP
jgi:hypothetical protein